MGEVVNWKKSPSTVIPMVVCISDPPPLIEVIKDIYVYFCLLLAFIWLV